MPEIATLNEKIMGATIWLLIIYEILILLGIIAFVNGRQNKKWIKYESI